MQKRGWLVNLLKLQIKFLLFYIFLVCFIVSIKVTNLVKLKLKVIKKKQYEKDE